MKLPLPGAEETSLGPGAQHFGALLEETAPSLLFLAVVGKKGPSREGEERIIHKICLKFA